VDYRIVEASAREVFEAYWGALERGEPTSIFFWREILLERLGVLSGATDNSSGPPGAHRNGQEGQRGPV
jgi:hypothetical protein